MKRIVLLFSLSLFAAILTAQTMKIHRGQIAVALALSEVGQMNYADNGATLQIAGTGYAVEEIDSIVVVPGTVDPLSVEVCYAGNLAFVTASADVVSALKLDVKGADVQVWADASLQEEVTYSLSGESSDGSFFMEGEYKSTLVLDGLTLSNKRGAAIDIANGKRLNVVLTDGTVNTLSDGAGGTHDACFFVNGHPEFSGAGSLILTGNTKHAFASDEYTQLKPGTGRIEVKGAVNDGLHIKQYFLMQGGEVVVNGTAGDCIDVSITKDPLDEKNGQIIVEAGSLTLDVAADDKKGMKCDDSMTISGGTIKANVSGDGTKGLSVGTDLLIQQKTEVPTRIEMTVTGTTYMPDDPELESKCRGIKVKGNFVFDGGDIKISATGKKSKAISVDGTYTYKSGTINCYVDAN